MKTQRLQLPNNHKFTGRLIRTFLADDDPFMLALLARLLDKHPRILIVGSAADGRKAFHSAATLRAELVLTDLHMPIVDGVELARRLKQLPNPPVVYMVTSDDSSGALTASLNAGADAFLAKSPDLAIQLQLALDSSFPTIRESENPTLPAVYELATANN
ncbi:MAG TPA: response regulator transcription factor [Verrucomicrobiae bacterium]|nr:response regulator transcription factor [Verrucomicrobiae bacterium]